MLARLLVVHPENERVLLFVAVIVIFDNDGEFLLLEVESSEFGPEEQHNLLVIFEHQYGQGSEAQPVLAMVLTQ